MATGRMPFRGNTAAAVFGAILHETPVRATSLNPALPLKLEEIIQKALEKDRELRAQSAAELRSDLMRLKRDIDFKPRGHIDGSDSKRRFHTGHDGRNPIASHWFNAAQRDGRHGRTSVAVAGHRCVRAGGLGRACVLFCGRHCLRPE